jgi:hypothetical protein
MAILSALGVIADLCLDFDFAGVGMMPGNKGVCLAVR